MKSTDLYLTVPITVLCFVHVCVWGGGGGGKFIHGLYLLLYGISASASFDLPLPVALR